MSLFKSPTPPTSRRSPRHTGIRRPLPHRVRGTTLGEDRSHRSENHGRTQQFHSDRSKRGPSGTRPGDSVCHGGGHVGTEGGFQPLVPLGSPLPLSTRCDAPQPSLLRLRTHDSVSPVEPFPCRPFIFRPDPNDGAKGGIFVSVSHLR